VKYRRRIILWIVYIVGLVWLAIWATWRHKQEVAHRFEDSLLQTITRRQADRDEIKRQPPHPDDNELAVISATDVSLPWIWTPDNQGYLRNATASFQYTAALASATLP
jgi:FtsZ-interacting cell division protein ZipA